MKHALPAAVIFLAVLASADAAVSARLFVEDDAIAAHGLSLQAPPRASYAILDGPREDVRGFASKGTPIEISADLPAALTGRGSAMFWFKTPESYASGLATNPFIQPLLSLGGAANISLVVEKSSITLLTEWEGSRADVFERHIRMILPSLPGPAWHHLAIAWDSATGYCNAFLNGTPYYVVGEPTAPFPIRAANTVTVHLGRFAIADLRVDAAPVTAEALRDIVGSEYFGRSAGLLGAQELPIISVPTRRGAVVYARTLESAADLRDWVLEGPGVVVHRDGWLNVRSALPDGPQGHVVYWCPEVFPDRFAAEWEFELLAPKGLCIVFFAARGRRGRDLFDPALERRTGIFNQYTNGDIDAYHISYFANTPAVPRAVANLRKNHGFFVLANGPVGVDSGRSGDIHRALLVKDGPRIQMAVDDRTIIDFTDDGKRAGPVWTDGRIGFRQMQWTVARYRNFKVYALE